MCERNLLRSGFVGSLLNFPTTDFYFPNVRSSGVQFSSLPPVSYGRREVCSLPWTNPSSCTSPQQDRAFSGFTQPLLARSVPPTSNINNHSKGSLEKSSAYFNLQDAYHKPEYPSGPGTSLVDEHGFAGTVCAARCDYSVTEGQSQSSGANFEHNTSIQANVQNCNESKTVAVEETLGNPCDRASFCDGATWCGSQVRSRKKRKPYAKQQLAELENEFMMNEFINRQKRKELSIRLDLTDQQIKIWFQNRRMKKKRLLMRDHAFSMY